MTAAELRQILAGMPDDALVLMPGVYNIPVQRYNLVRYAVPSDVWDNEGAAEYITDADYALRTAVRRPAVILRML